MTGDGLPALVALPRDHHDVTGSCPADGERDRRPAVADLGDATGTPLTQLNLVVAALWGVALYNEVRGARAVAVFALSVACAIGAALLLLLDT